MKQIRLLIAYDGGGYLGWQKTRMGPSIEESLEKVLFQVLQEEVSLQAASRTDAGVHALGQNVTFKSFQIPENLKQFSLSLNRLLPTDISVMEADLVHLDFHPSLDSFEKEYHYHLCLGMAQNPLERHFSWYCPYQLNLLEMERGAERLMGEHDFAAFTNVQMNDVKGNSVRTISRLKMVPLANNRIRIEIIGNAFLYKMVRNIVGTLVAVGRGSLEASSLTSLLLKKDRKLMGMTAPAHGLSLIRVGYSSKDTL